VTAQYIVLLYIRFTLASGLLVGDEPHLNPIPLHDILKLEELFIRVALYDDGVELFIPRATSDEHAAVVKRVLEIFGSVFIVIRLQGLARPRLQEWGG
jgi:hypothetical protein